MLIDCDTCEVRDIACNDCVVTVLLGPTRLDAGGATFAPRLPLADLADLADLAMAPAGMVEIGDEERTALSVLAESGLVPPLRLVRPADPRDRMRSADHAV